MNSIVMDNTKGIIPKVSEMKILVYGANGWIGQQFIDILETKQLDYIPGISRVDDYDTVLREIVTTNPTHVVSFIGRTHGKIGDKQFTTIDYLEQEGKLQENVRDNLYSPLLLSMICKNHNIHYTYLGTGVFLSLMNVTLLVRKRMDLPNNHNQIFLVHHIQL